MLHDVFGTFSESESSVTELDLTEAATFLQSLCESMQCYYDDEASRAEEARKLLISFINVPIQKTILGKSETDGSATLLIGTSTMIYYLIFEGKKELGSTNSDPFMQGLAYSINSYTTGIKEGGLECSIPCFIITIAGPHFGISGCINAKSFVQYQQLTPLFSLVHVPGCGFSRDLLYSLIALKKAVQKVQAIKIHKTISNYPYFLKFTAKDGNDYDIEYTKRISGLVFQAKLLLNGTVTHDVIVKFSSQYGCEPHNHCAD